MKFKAVLFDCDGVLVDSEPISRSVLLKSASEFGVDLDHQDVLTRFAGHSMSDCIDEIRASLDLPLPADFYQKFRDRELTELAESVTMIPGIDVLLDRLSIPFCVASNGPQEKMLVTLGATGLLDRFQQNIFSAYDINEFKPDPGLYVHAAKEMGISPAECLVVEDSVVGATAGVRAGMAVAVYLPNHQDDASQILKNTYPGEVYGFVDAMPDVASIAAG